MNKQINDLKLIKDKYGEKMMQFCRNVFSIILENPGLLFKLLSNNFEFNKFLYDDLSKANSLVQFKDYIYSLIDIEKYSNQKEFIITKTPEELLNDAGYDLFECRTEEEIQKFKKYYAENEQLCTFNGGRLNKCYVFFAVKKNVENIKRENFNNPKREDEYGTSVISIQFSKGINNTLSIKNRYNHRVNNPDATFKNNLENIIPGLTKSFEKKYNLRINQNDNLELELKNYVKASDGKYYKYNYEINNIYYCPNNIIIDTFDVIKDYEAKEKYLVFDWFILDLAKKKIFLYDEICDTFIQDLNNINKIQITKEKETGNKIINLFFKEKLKVIIKVDKLNRIVYYENNNIKYIGDDFLYNNDSIKQIFLPNVKIIGDNFLCKNIVLETIEIPCVEKIGNNFLYNNGSIKQISLPNMKIIGDNFLCKNIVLETIEISNNLETLKKNNKKIIKFKQLNLLKLKHSGIKFILKKENIEINRKIVEKVKKLIKKW